MNSKVLFEAQVVCGRFIPGRFVPRTVRPKWYKIS